MYFFILYLLLEHFKFKENDIKKLLYFQFEIYTNFQAIGASSITIKYYK